MNEKTQALFNERLNRVETAMHLGTPDRVPLAPFFSSWPQRKYGSSYTDLYYDFETAGDAMLKFYKEHPMLDTVTFSGFTSGKANELAQSQMIDWPGRPGSIVSKYSSHQVIELELMTQDEYPELLSDFTGFMLRKYIPRAFPALKGLSSISFAPACILNTAFLLTGMYTPDAMEAYRLLGQIAKADSEAFMMTGKYLGEVAELGFPAFFTHISEAPYDILGDYYRGTMGMFEDLVDENMHGYIDEACEMFAQQQIAALQSLKDINMPVKRVFFPLHKAMDGFMNDEQFIRFYWKPLKKIIMALIDMDITPMIYTEGPYNSRLEYLTDVPKGKVVYHFEKVDMKRAKEILQGTACIYGNLPVALIEFGKKEDVITATRKLLDDCMPGGGYIFDFDGNLENAKQENLDAMFETLDKYGKY